MGWIVKTPKSEYRANWRDLAGRQRAKTFKRSSDAKRFLSEMESQLAKGIYIDPHAGQKILFRGYANEWLKGRTVEIRTSESSISMLRTHAIPRWGEMPLSKIDHVGVQQWVSELSAKRKPATVIAAFGVLSMILEMAVRARILAFNPCEGIKLPKRRNEKHKMTIISRDDFHTKLLPAVPKQYRGLVCLAAGTGLRWGESVGLGWDHLDLEAKYVQVQRVAIESSGRVTLREYPKSRAGVRRVPLPNFTIQALKVHARDFRYSDDLVFATGPGGALRRATFRQRIWLPALVRAGLLGQVEGVGPYTAHWTDSKGCFGTAILPTELAAIKHVIAHSGSGLRFHDLRHSYATWLVTDRIPVNVVQRLMGHENASTTLNRYVHAPTDHDDIVRDVFNDDRDPKTDC